MKVLIVQPEYAKSYWSLDHFMRFTGKKPAFPAKELLLISILLPITWNRKIVDTNFDRLRESDLQWSDYIFINASEKQYKSTVQILNKSESASGKIVGCGPLFTEYFGEFEKVDHLVLDNIRKTLPKFINDLENNNAKKVYHSNPFFEIRKASESYYSVKRIAGKFSDNIQLAYY
ncbi:hypothetical protein OU798_09995 [Prolixibacteraceae bacterium Z1-6]|uniref:Radical SAM protein n=1 Tax=Draconibacterium aestuarii TaxID=2998507 RepID=A0A9X3J7G3_9BACT|nr:hypothetical protein [Prolixibacteraceae bacterium Z1-6]